jgi:hypothetical protein
MAKTPKAHISMRGVQINMEEMRSKNEDVVAVTGHGAQFKMNARGDTLALGGRVDRRREEIDSDYQTSLEGNVKRVESRDIKPDVFETPQEVVERLKVVKEQPKPQAQKPVVPVDNSIRADDTKPEQKPVKKLSEKED